MVFIPTQSIASTPLNSHKLNEKGRGNYNLLFLENRFE